MFENNKKQKKLQRMKEVDDRKCAKCNCFQTSKNSQIAHMYIARPCLSTLVSDSKNS